MKFLNHIFLATLFILLVVAPHPGRAQTNTAKTQNKTVASLEGDTQKKNMQEYIALLRSDVRQQKAEIMGAVMLLSAQDATKLWPI